MILRSPEKRNRSRLCRGRSGLTHDENEEDDTHDDEAQLPRDVLAVLKGERKAPVVLEGADDAQHHFLFHFRVETHVQAAPPRVKMCSSIPRTCRGVHVGKTTTPCRAELTAQATGELETMLSPTNKRSPGTPSINTALNQQTQ